MSKSNVLLVGSGAVGTMGAYALESGSQATVTALLRSNFDVVSKDGFKITSIDHGNIEGWKPSKVCKSIEEAAEGIKTSPFDYIVVTTKNIPDVPPTVTELITPAVTPGHTVIVLVQNGINIERPVIAAFPSNVVLSGVSRISASQPTPGCINHTDHDILFIGPFENPNLSAESQKAAAESFVKLYNSGGKVQGELQMDVKFVRWRKLLYNACWNPICTITRTDTTRLRMAGFPIDDLVRPAMLEIIQIAKAVGVNLPEGIENFFLEKADNIDAYFRPSMTQDIDKGNLIEYENLVGEPMREAEAAGIPAPTIKMFYGLLKILQAREMEAKGMIDLKHTSTKTSLK